MIKHLLSFCAAAAMTLCSYAQNEVASFFEGTPVSEIGDEGAYFYNTEAGVFMTKGNDWGTRVSFTGSDHGLLMRFVAVDDSETYRLEDFDNDRWRQLDCDGGQSSWIDGDGRQGHNTWSYTECEDGTFTITNTYGTGNFSVVPSKEDTRIYFSDAEEAQCHWIAVTPDAYEEGKDAWLEYAQEKIEQANAKAAVKAVNTIDAFLKGTNFYTQEALDAFLEKYPVADWLAAIEAGSFDYTEVGDALKNIGLVVTGWHAGIDADDLLTSVWEGADGNFGGKYYINSWSTEGENDGSNFKVPFFEYWTGDGNSLEARELVATITGLTPGKEYSVTAWTRVRIKDGATGTPAGITLQVGEGTAVDVCAGAQVGSSQMYIDHFTATGAADAEGNLVVKYIIAEDNNVSWLAYKDVYYEEGEPERDLEAIAQKVNAAIEKAGKMLAAEGEDPTAFTYEGNLFFPVEGASEALLKAIDEASNLEIATATDEEIDVALDNLKKAMNPDVVLPEADKKYVIINVNSIDEEAQTCLYMTVNHENAGVRLSAQKCEFSFVAVEGGWNLVCEDKYVGMAGNNKWTMSNEADKAKAWTINTLLPSGNYTIQGETGLIGTDALDEGAACYGDKKAEANGVWMIVCVDDSEAEPELQYESLAICVEDEDWASQYDLYEVDGNIAIEAYEDFVVVKNFDGVEGYDIKVSFDADEAVTAVEPAGNATESSSYIYSGKAYWYIYTDEGYAYASSDAETESGYVIMLVYVNEEYYYYSIEWDKDIATGVTTAKAVKVPSAEIFNLAGQRLDKMTKGINIVGGKKVLK